jgi:uncharacterized protein YeaO (DUF488 family)
MGAGEIRTRRWNDRKRRGDGMRLLVCRYRPRALPKAEETWGLWWKDLGPSKELLGGGSVSLPRPRFSAYRIRSCPERKRAAGRRGEDGQPP